MPPKKPGEENNQNNNQENNNSENNIVNENNSNNINNENYNLNKDNAVINDIHEEEIVDDGGNFNIDNFMQGDKQTLSEKQSKALHDLKPKPSEDLKEQKKPEEPKENNIINDINTDSKNLLDEDLNLNIIRDNKDELNKSFMNEKDDEDDFLLKKDEDNLIKGILNDDEEEPEFGVVGQAKIDPKDIIEDYFPAPEKQIINDINAPVENENVINLNDAENHINNNEEEIEIEVVDDNAPNKNNNLGLNDPNAPHRENVAQQMVNNVVGGNIVEPEDLGLKDFFDLADQQREENIAADNRSLALDLANFEKSIKSATGAKDFTSLSVSEINGLANLGITDRHGLLTSEIQNNSLINRTKATLIGTKSIANDTTLKSCATLLSDMERKHAARFDKREGNLDYENEGKLIEDYKKILQGKGIDTTALSDLNNLANEDQREWSRIVIRNNAARHEAAHKNDADTPDNNIRTMKKILGARPIEDLSRDDIQAITKAGIRQMYIADALSRMDFARFEARKNNEIDTASMTKEQIAAAKRENAELTQKLQAIKQLLNGPDYIHPDDVNKAVEHLANQEINLHEMDPKNPEFSKYEHSVMRQRELLLGKGIPFDTLSKMVAGKMIANMAELKDSMDKLVNGDKNPRYKEMNKAYESLRTNVLQKGVRKDDLPGYIENKGKDLFERNLGEVETIMQTKFRLEKPFWNNIDELYNQMGKAWDVENHELGCDLGLESLKVTAHTIREFSLYAKELAMHGKVAESDYAQKQVGKIGQFLINKGISKENLKSILNADTKDLDQVSKDIMTGIEKEKQAKEKNEEKVLDDKNENRKQIEVKVEPKIELKNEDYAKEMEQFPDVKMVKDPKDFKVEKEVNLVVDSKNKNVIEELPAEPELNSLK